MLKGVIDIGTNSVRLGIQSGKTMQKYVITTRLGQGSAKGRLQPEPMRRTAEAVCSLLQKAAQQGVGEAYVYATAAVREAENSAEFERMLADCGVLLQILPGAKEALIAFAKAANGGTYCARNRGKRSAAPRTGAKAYRRIGHAHHACFHEAGA